MGVMRVVAKRTLREFWESQPKYGDAKSSLEAWHDEVVNADWENPQQVKSQFHNASILKDSRVVFNIKGNNYRLVTKINYPYRIVYVRFIGTHQQYDEINVETI
jgi:mRNA interferase HigB